MKQTASLIFISPLLCCDCGSNQGGRLGPAPAVSQPLEQTQKNDPNDRSDERERMVREQIERRNIKNQQVLQAMRRVPRHLFVPMAYRDNAYEDRALPIEDGQTISQPYIVGLMTELARVNPGETVLEVGTGSGYQAAVLADMGVNVYSVEIVATLAESAKERLLKLGYRNVHVRHGDGYDGWKEHAPFDAILITAAPPHIPEPLKQQLKVGGRLVVPVGEWQQQLIVLRRTKTGFEKQSIIPVIFVPMTGKIQSENP
ncbi:MAG: protein-L-isoaspartate(D-aspartate) O-methyltransferase [Deltaproteobacteria bacterium]|nr:protein-L-isoaspartate(D-aspartate) O-methyltransferase [Deltaproteobacteria bacterium]